MFKNRFDTTTTKKEEGEEEAYEINLQNKFVLLYITYLLYKT